MEINLTLPNGEPAARTEIGLSTLDLATLAMKIEVIGYDTEGNKLAIIYVPHQIDQPREVTREEIEAVVMGYFHQSGLQE